MCKTLKSLSEFNKDKGHWNGYDNDCRECKKAYKKMLHTKGRLKKFDWRARLQQQYRRILSDYSKKDISWL